MFRSLYDWKVWHTEPCFKKVRVFKAEIQLKTDASAAADGLEGVFPQLSARPAPFPEWVLQHAPLHQSHQTSFISTELRNRAKSRQAATESHQTHPGQCKVNRDTNTGEKTPPRALEVCETSAVRFDWARPTSGQFVHGWHYITFTVEAEDHAGTHPSRCNMHHTTVTLHRLLTSLLPRFPPAPSLPPSFPPSSWHRHVPMCDFLAIFRRLPVLPRPWLDGVSAYGWFQRAQRSGRAFAAARRLFLGNWQSEEEAAACHCEAPPFIWRAAGEAGSPQCSPPAL